MSVDEALNRVGKSKGWIELSVDVQRCWLEGTTKVISAHSEQDMASAASAEPWLPVTNS